MTYQILRVFAQNSCVLSKHFGLCVPSRCHRSLQGYSCVALCSSCKCKVHKCLHTSGTNCACHARAVRHAHAIMFTTYYINGYLLEF